ncbi:hypothetical protein M422DRAFT_271716 [Sphaerobolus stellatus SS14]|uniref:Ribonuclease H n=1 Tax=Sphaerobolus stellatus (strain SS14) TaxID=990650 RepID=A0A0C9UDH0_SPHS4|nr:hypothetical protein M422DRAFT_271716 [Sphaerobolus stellatus SS14]
MSTPSRWYYAVHKGRNPGVYNTWAQCEPQVRDFANAKYKKFHTYTEAENFVQYGWASLHGPVPPSPSPSPSPSPRRPTDVQLNLAALSLNDYSTENITVLDSREWKTAYCETYENEDGNVGIGVWWEQDNSENVSERCQGMKSLDKGLMAGAVRALEAVPSGNASIRPCLTIQVIQNAVNIMKAEGVPERIKERDMPLSIYLPQLMTRVRHQGRRIRIKRVKEESDLQSRGVRVAKELAIKGSYKKTSRSLWGLTIKGSPKETSRRPWRLPVGNSSRGACGSVASLKFQL